MLIVLQKKALKVFDLRTWCIKPLSFQIVHLEYLLSELNKNTFYKSAKYLLYVIFFLFTLQYFHIYYLNRIYVCYS